MVMSNDITIVCKEYDKYADRKPVTYIVTRKATGADINILQLRGRFNPELRYYATLAGGTDEDILKIAKATLLREPMFVRL